MPVSTDLQLGPGLLGRLLAVVDRVTLGLAAVGVLVFTTLVTSVALGRYLTGHSPYWSEELPRTLLIWTVFIGLVPTTIRGGHLNAGLLHLIVPAGLTRKALEAAARIATSTFLGVVAWTGWDFAVAGHDSVTTALQIPSSIVYAALPIGAGLAAIVNLLVVAVEPRR